MWLFFNCNEVGRPWGQVWGSWVSASCWMMDSISSTVRWSPARTALWQAIVAARAFSTSVVTVSNTSSSSRLVSIPSGLPARLFITAGTVDIVHSSFSPRGDGESVPFQEFAVFPCHVGLLGAEGRGYGDQHSLRLGVTLLGVCLEVIVKYPLVGGVLVEQAESVGVVGDDIGAGALSQDPELPQGDAEGLVGCQSFF